MLYACNTGARHDGTSSYAGCMYILYTVCRVTCVNIGGLYMNKFEVSRASNYYATFGLVHARVLRLGKMKVSRTLETSI